MIMSTEEVWDLLNKYPKQVEAMPYKGEDDFACCCATPHFTVNVKLNHYKNGVLSDWYTNNTETIIIDTKVFPITDIEAFRQRYETGYKEVQRRDLDTKEMVTMKYEYDFNHCSIGFYGCMGISKVEELSIYDKPFSECIEILQEFMKTEKFSSLVDITDEFNEWKNRKKG